MAGLVAVGGPEIIAARRTRGRPTLAICVGHQVLFEAGIEHGLRTEGCGIWPGLVEQLHAARLPHMGWNTIEAADSSQLFAGIESDRFYFVHSYGVRALPAAPSGASRGPNMAATGSWRRWRRTAVVHPVPP